MLVHCAIFRQNSTFVFKFLLTTFTAKLISPVYFLLTAVTVCFIAVKMGYLQKLKFYIKSFIFGSLIASCALYGVFASIFLRIIGKSEYAQYTVARAFYHLFSRLLGIKIVIKNEHLLHKKPAVVISNHQSALDILVLGKIFQPGYTVTAKKALKYLPFLGWFMLASKTFFLDRARGEKARKVLDQALLSLKENDRALFMFPEGTRSAIKKLDMLPFKKGAFHLAKQAKIPVIPVAVQNYSTLFHSRDKIFKRGEIVIEVMEPESSDHLETKEDVDEFVILIRNKMLKSIESMGYASTVDEKKPAPASPVEQESNEAASDESVEVISESTPLISTD